MTDRQVIRTVLNLTFTNRSQLRIGADDEVFKDYQGNPYIPSTSLKGAARAALVRGGYGGDADILFGMIKNSEDKSGQIGKIVFSGAVGNSATIKSLKRSSIDDASGVAAHTKLFEQDYVATDTTWTARLSINGTLAELATVKKLLARWSNEGLALGRNKGDGDGLLKLTVIEVNHFIERVGPLVTIIPNEKQRLSEQQKDEWAVRNLGVGFSEQGKSWVLELMCDGPFAILHGKAEGPCPAGEKANELKSIGFDKTPPAPTLPGSSFMGALRSKAEWLEAVGHLRNGTTNNKKATISLFGSEDNAGVLVVDEIMSIGPSTTKMLTSVKIDRFTQGTIDGALFTIGAFIDPKFKVRLRLTSRASKDDEDFAQKLLAYLTTPGPNNGMEIGHGHNRGFGWFGVSVVEKKELIDAK